MLKDIIGLLLLLTAINGFAQQTIDGDKGEPDESIDAVSSSSSSEFTDDAELAKVNQPQAPLTLLDTVVPPATAQRLSWQPNQSLDGLSQPTPVLVVNGAQTGPVLCLTAAVHGDELNGIEIVRRILHGIDPEQLSGAIIGVPIVNLQGFQRASRYLSDRRDLNRFFPGNSHGSSASRMAHSFFHEIISHCQYVVDIHTGSAHRTNLPQVRANLHDINVEKFARAFGIPVILHSKGTEGMLRYAAVEANIPAVTLEMGESMTLQETAVRHGVKGIKMLLSKMKMLNNSLSGSDPESIYYQSAWVRADQGGILLSNVGLGDRVNKNKVLGVITDPITNMRSEIISPYDGQVIGMAFDQIVMPGFAGFHIGLQKTEEKLSGIENKSNNSLAASQSVSESESE
ncbi:MAG: deacylase [Nitrosomonas sp.]|nr:MAG: deacylase [Nitrosomonas sp.]